MSDTCPACGRPWEEHTIGDARTCAGTPTEPTFPYEEIPGGPIFGALGNIPISSSCTVRAGVLPTILSATGKLPVLAFQFFGAAREVVADVALVLDAEGFERFRTLVNDSIDGAIRAAK